ncbi:GNAT family N-acetyltransferase [Shimia marina]|uniref:Aminoalkylphosphonic acid N-acetyltransferase n=1 Tax=Shimia marina TaxID=321267 RepID=A0A0P1EUI4_9RHOB|nr:GNAT family N-acetyltransferase [Shimia marina]CUH54318.1 aminoalkylphosphonic acid N-acetyltransferase [Shimia marina]SFE00392.1 Ribosomal protein S18 acetylase RimI [Shimia marina]
MQSDILVRDAMADDYDKWRPLWDQYNAFYGRSGDTALSEQIVQSTWSRFLDPDEPVHCLLAECDGEIVGLAHFVFHRNTITIENTCYLQDLFSTPVMRGKGVGRKLILSFYDRAQQAGTVGVYWHTQSTNHTAMRLYDQVATNTEFVVYRQSLRNT